MAESMKNETGPQEIAGGVVIAQVIAALLANQQFQKLVEDLVARVLAKMNKV